MIFLFSDIFFTVVFSPFSIVHSISPTVFAGSYLTFISNSLSSSVISKDSVSNFIFSAGLTEGAPGAGEALPPPA